METLNKISVMNVGFIGNGKGRKALLEVKKQTISPKNFKRAIQ